MVRCRQTVSEFDRILSANVKLDARDAGSLAGTLLDKAIEAAQGFGEHRFAERDYNEANRAFRDVEKIVEMRKGFEILD